MTPWRSEHTLYHLYSHLLFPSEYKRVTIGRMWLDTSESGVHWCCFIYRPWKCWPAPCFSGRLWLLLWNVSWESEQFTRANWSSMTRRDDLVGARLHHLSCSDEGEMDADQVVTFQGYSGWAVKPGLIFGLSASTWVSCSGSEVRCRNWEGFGLACLEKRYLSLTCLWNRVQSVEFCPAARCRSDN